MTVTFKLDSSKVEDGTVLLVGIAYQTMRDKVWTYSIIKAGGRWYTSGTGKTPQDAGWGAIDRWLSDPVREVRWIRVVTQTELLFERFEARDDLDPATPGRRAPGLTLVHNDGFTEPDDADSGEDTSPPWAERMLADLDGGAEGPAK